MNEKCKLYLDGKIKIIQSDLRDAYTYWKLLENLCNRLRNCDILVPSVIRKYKGFRTNKSNDKNPIVTSTHRNIFYSITWKIAGILANHPSVLHLFCPWEIPLHVRERLPLITI